MDNDEGDNRQTKFFLAETETSKFKITRKTGEIVLKKSLDEDDANQVYNLTIMAEDQGLL